MHAGPDFLVAARQCEIAELEQLGRTGELVGVIARFIHVLQRERGISSIFLASQGRQFGGPRHRQVAECEALERDLRAQFESLDAAASRLRNGARLFTRIAVVLHALDALGELRRRIAALAIAPREATDAFARLIAGLLAVVFEAADGATDPGISRALVAMFNFMQGKEFAGQERALGASVFASGHADPAAHPHWRHLIESQAACFQVFIDFSEESASTCAYARAQAAVPPELDRLRGVGCALHTGKLHPSLSQIWYESTTRRIDAMKLAEDLLAINLRRLCESKIAQARAELRDQEAIVESLSRQATAAPCEQAPRYGPNVGRSVLEMVQEQSARLQAMSDQLEAARSALNERKLVERAKGLLMTHRQLSEHDAYKTLRQMAMNQKRRLADVAQTVVSMADVLPPR